MKCILVEKCDIKQLVYLIELTYVMHDLRVCQWWRHDFFHGYGIDKSQVQSKRRPMFAFDFFSITTDFLAIRKKESVALYSRNKGARLSCQKK